jgi:hypothetical protein
LDVKPIVGALVQSQAHFADEEELSRMSQRVELLYKCRELGPDKVFDDASSATASGELPDFSTILGMLPPAIMHDITTPISGEIRCQIRCQVY